jgi:hypothetical protein
MREVLRLVLKPILNSYNFFCLYANSDGLRAENILNNEDLFTVRKGKNAKLASDAKLVGESGSGSLYSECLYYVFYRRGEPVAFARVRPDGEKFNISEFALIRELRDKYASKQFIKYIIGDILAIDTVKEIDALLPASLRDFCETLGFVSVPKVMVDPVRMFVRVEDLSGNDYSHGNNLLDNGMDIYILSKLKETVRKMEVEMSNYDFADACRESESFFDILNNWYLRRNRSRFWKSKKDGDKQNAYNVLYSVLLTMVRAIAPLAPFVSEYIWQGLTRSTVEV